MRLRVAPAFVGLCALSTALGCFNPGDGSDPPDNGLYFPVGIAVSQSGKTLFVVNSDFDLRYNAGTVQALDLAQIWNTGAKACLDAIAPRKIDSATGNVVANVPDRSCLVGTDVLPFIKSAVRIGAFGADVVSTPRYDASGNIDPPGSPRGRLLIPVRGDATLTIIDYEEAVDASGNVGARTLICSPKPQANSFGTACSSEWRVGGDANQNSRLLALEGEPFAVAVSSYWPTTKLQPPVDPADPSGPTYESPRNVGGLAAIVHQQTGDVSVFVRTAGFDGQTIPQAKLALTINGFPAGGTFIAPLDILDEHPFTPRFIVTTRSQANAYVVSFFADKGSIDRSYLVTSQIATLPTQSPGYDSRGVVVDPPEDGEARTDTRVFLTSRTPASLVVGKWDHTAGLRFFDNVELPIGPSRIVRARLEVEQEDGTFVKRTRLLATSFDGRFVTIFDPDAGRTTDVVRTGKGPYTIAVADSLGTRGTADYRPALGFVTNFTDSTIQVIDLDPRAGLLDAELEAAGHPEKKAPAGTIGPLYGQIIYTIGIVQKPGN